LSKDIGVYKKQPKKKQPFNNQQYNKINVLLQVKIFHRFLEIYPLQQSQMKLLSSYFLIVETIGLPPPSKNILQQSLI